MNASQSNPAIAVAVVCPNPKIALTFKAIEILVEGKAREVDAH